METQLPPPMVLYQLATAHYFSQAVYVAAKLGIADHLADGPQTHDALAQGHRHARARRSVACSASSRPPACSPSARTGASS